MRIPPFSILLSMLLYCICLPSHVSVVSGLCLEDQQSLLLQLKNTLKFNSSESSKLVSWNQSLPCCDWSGITCDKEGYVIALDLSWESIYEGLDNSSAIFSLQHLQNLDLSFNKFNTSIPPTIKNLKNLTSLMLEEASFVGQIPNEISQLTRLVTLSIYSNDEFQTEIIDLRKIVQNLTRIRELDLFRVSMSTMGQEWSDALLALPSLEHLGIAYCNLSGPINLSHTRLENLSTVFLDGNNFSSIVPGSFANLKKLTSLILTSNGLRGIFPEEIFHIATLSHIDISSNIDLFISFPNYPINTSLNGLTARNTKFSAGLIPNSISNLRQLTRLDLTNCNLNGTFPNSLLNLTKLTLLYLSSNNFIGPIPSLFSLTNLTHLDLTSNNFIGPIPSSLFALPWLEVILLSFNHFDGQINLDIIQSLKYLEVLELSYNNLSIDANAMNANLSHFPNLKTVRLASCNLREFPLFLRNQSFMLDLDLSNNQIQGLIPHWIWKIGEWSYLNLSKNSLTGFEGSFLNLSREISVLDLHSNQLKGEIPIFQVSRYLDYSSNNFNSVIPYDITAQLSSTKFLFLSKNNFHGNIPHSLCNASNLEVLDLSNNNLEGTILECLTQIENLGVLNLRNNKLKDNIPNTFPKSCALKTLDLHRNGISGLIPRSLGNCMELEVLDLGNNQIGGHLPCLLKKISTLRVMVLQKNKLQGPLDCLNTNDYNWSLLQIIDLSFNNFDGLLPARAFTTWEAMMQVEDQAKQIQFSLNYNNHSYQDSVTVITKGLELKLVKILTVFTSIDFSSNNFKGSVPEELMKFKGLHGLNLSNNALSGQIPSSIMNLKQLESLDLSNNSLSGEIPTQLASLFFLEFLNLSFNHLVGRIPTGTQLQSFEAASFKGNDGLYGPPLTNITKDQKHGMLSPPISRNHHKFDLNLITSVELGVVFGLGVIIGPILFWKKWRTMYWKCVDNILCNIFPQLYLDYQRREGQMYTVLHWRC